MNTAERMPYRCKKKMEKKVCIALCIYPLKPSGFCNDGNNMKVAQTNATIRLCDAA